jgi:hypothetical protein
MRVSAFVAAVAALATGQPIISLLHRIDAAMLVRSPTSFATSGGETLLVLGTGFGVNASAIQGVSFGGQNCTALAALPWNATTINLPGGVATIIHPADGGQPWLTAVRR